MTSLTKLTETLVICDDSSWVWKLASEALGARPHIRIPSTAPIRVSWERFKDAERIIIFWENLGRGGGAIVEEIMEIAPMFDVTNRVIILAMNPRHEDVVYWSELGLSRIVKLRMREADLKQGKEEILNHLSDAETPNLIEAQWLRIYRALRCVQGNVAAHLHKLSEMTAQLLASCGGKPSARYYDVMATIAHLKGNDGEALKLWDKALALNANYFRSYNSLIEFHFGKGNFDACLGLMRQMNNLNHSKVSRMVQMGEIHANLGEDGKAEHYFNSALARDSYCSGAMNGLAALRFKQGSLDESRRLLSQSAISYKLAATLNVQGINLVKVGKFKEALDLYTKAQYVLPQQDKGPMIFYNMGLCYARWGRPEIGKKFLDIALIKEPNYNKAKKLLQQIALDSNGHAA